MPKASTKTSIRLLATLTLLALSATASAAEAIARAGAVELDSAAVRSLVANLPAASRAAAAKDAKVLEQLVRVELAGRAVVAEARKAGFERKSEVVLELDRAREETLGQLWLAAQSQPASDYPSAVEVAAAYERHQSALQSPPEFRLAQIYIEAANAADPATLAKALRKVTELAVKLAPAGADFARLAREYSDQPDSAANGGELGWLPEDQLIAEVRSAVSTLKIGELAGPLKTQQGFHFVKLLEKKSGRTLSLEEVRERLTAALRNERAQAMQQRYLAELADRLAISVNQIGLAALQGTLR